MLLYSVDALREELGFDDMPDITTAITTALHTAETLIGATLRTTFDKKEGVVDTFYVKEPTVEGVVPQTEFLLRHGFIDGTPVAESNGLELPMEFMTEKGVGRDWKTTYKDQLVTISYDCGFDSDDDNEASYDLEQVPGWLQQAAKIKALMFLAKLPAITEAQIELDTNMLDQQYAALINTHIRYAPLALLPL